MTAGIEAFGDRKPVIAYPCRWGYRVIGGDEGRMRHAVAEALDGEEYDLRLSNVSRTGRYTALKVAVLVRDEQHRLALFRALAGRPEFTHVL